MSSLRKRKVRWRLHPPADRAHGQIYSLGLKQGRKHVRARLDSMPWWHATVYPRRGRELVLGGDHVISGLLDDEARSERIGQLIAVLAAEGENSIARADALGLLVGEFTSPLYRQAYRIVGNVEDTKDVVAEVTAKFVCKFDFSRLAGATDPAAVIGAFLRTTTRRTALDTVRLRAKLAPYPEFDDSLVGSFGLSELDATLLRDAVAKLETAHREVVMLRYFLDLTLAEVAVALGVSLTTVKNRLRAALAVLKRLLDDGDSTQGPALSA